MAKYLCGVATASAPVFDASAKTVTRDTDVETATTLSINWKNMRRKRDGLLHETDWVITMHKELGTNIPSAWKDYRKALRDLPANTSDPTNVTWPTKPS